MPNMKNEIIDGLIDYLENYKGAHIYGCDLAYTLFERYNVDGSVTYSTYKATQWIKEHFDELGDYVENMKLNGLDSANPFDEPEKFMVQIYLEVASEVLSNCDLVNDNWNEQIELNDKNIAKLTKQLEELKE